MELVIKGASSVTIDQVVLFIRDYPQFKEEAISSIKKLRDRNKIAKKSSQDKVSTLCSNSIEYKSLHFSISINENLIDSYENVLKELYSIH